MSGTERNSNEGAWTLPGLAALGPDPAFRDQLRLFGQFVGDWRILECRIHTPTGAWRELEGELHWRWILRGKAIQDVWTLRDKGSGELFYEGTTIRVYDVKSGTWASTWISTSRPRARRFVGRAVGAEIVLDELVEAGAAPERWIFFNIASEAFRWRSEEQRPGGPTWEVTEEMRVSRVR